ncbi:MAG: type 1 glutamine amidotransferase-like domain-containing protein [Hamadaea sp.]|nr:type 1 glutamine amidotransferase-like domain-containing protein [Hamadaea sp.]
MAGPVALVGSGEYTDAMFDVDAYLLKERPPRYVQIPTAAAPEGDTSLAKWIGMGEEHAAKLGVEAVPLVVRDRADADDPAMVDRLGDPGLIYFSGGNPLFLAETFRGTLLWQAIVERWEAGSALGGCSAGAMAFGGWVPDIRHPTKPGLPGLGLFPHIQVLPHFDKFMGWMPDLMLRPFLRRREGVQLVGIDEDTALVGGPREFTVWGRSSAWLLNPGGAGGHKREGYAVGATLTIPA